MTDEEKKAFEALARSFTRSYTRMETLYKKKRNEVDRLTAENQRLKEEAAEQKSIAAHEHATQMEWFSIAGDYKTENAELRYRAEVAERALLRLCEETMRDKLIIMYPIVGRQVRDKQELYDYCIEKAERELAEEGKDG